MLKKIVLLLSVISLSFFVQPASASSHAKSLKNLGMNENPVNEIQNCLFGAKPKTLVRIIGVRALGFNMMDA